MLKLQVEVFNLIFLDNLCKILLLLLLRSLLDGQSRPGDVCCSLLKLVLVTYSWFLIEVPHGQNSSLRAARSGHLVRMWLTVIGSVSQGHRSLSPIPNLWYM